MEKKNNELTDNIQDKVNNGKVLDKSLYFDEDDDYNKYDDEEFMVGIY